MQERSDTSSVSGAVDSTTKEPHIAVSDAIFPALRSLTIDHNDIELAYPDLPARYDAAHLTHLTILDGNVDGVESAESLK